MKKSLLALALLSTGIGAQAATVYDKDGTSLEIGGRVQAVVYNGNATEIADHDAGLVNSARLNIGGKTKINDYVSAFAFAEWDIADGNKAATGDHISSRDQYVGADFNSFGKLTFGKQFDSLYSVQELTDIFEDFGAVMQGDTNGDRRTGLIRYDYDNYGFFGSVSYQTAQDDISVGGEDANVEGGYALALGYTFDEVWFGPLTFKAAYSYLRGQNDKFYALDGSYEYSNRFDNFRNTAVAVSWGSTDAGVYLAALYENTAAKQKQDFAVSRGYENDKSKGFELVAGYTFENGIGVFTGYEVSYKKTKLKGEQEENSAVTRRVPLFVNYSINENFNVWGEAEFDAGSSKSNSRHEIDTGTKLALGARYTF